MSIINSKILIKIIFIFICLIIVCNAFYGGDCGCCCDCCCDCCCGCCTTMLAIPCCCSYNSFGCYGGAIYGRRRRRSLQNNLKLNKRCTNELIKNKKCSKRFTMEMIERLRVQSGQRQKRGIERNQQKLDFLKKLLNK
uniref:Uncharacterized protein n=1 Tax=Meloidogyne enterolobii TaxID=390850 RepID=A0A6V7XS38_MELEN|nr:unnamed protein product [Meloidogyne enterolobii]